VDSANRKKDDGEITPDKKWKRNVDIMDTDGARRRWRHKTELDED